MKPTLEALIQAWDALQGCPRHESERRQTLYAGLIEDQLAAHPGLNRDRLESAVRLAHRRWLQRQCKPPAMPPRA
ncbi:MAG: hypothetical protein FJ387_07670 [Verrucomicrobia bacterium]|nr:hypothetical protein [Verrucomicrobiota bacterium]